MEQRKTIFIIMSALATMMMIGTLIWILITHSGDTQLLLVSASGLMCEVLMALAVLFPQFNNGYTLGREDGKVRFVKKSKKLQPDPRGYRYIGYGLVLLMMAVFFVLMEIFIALKGEEGAPKAICLLLPVMLVCLVATEVKIKKDRDV